jgi:hypothetical protein
MHILLDAPALLLLMGRLLMVRKQPAPCCLLTRSMLLCYVIPAFVAGRACSSECGSLHQRPSCLQADGHNTLPVDPSPHAPTAVVAKSIALLLLSQAAVVKWLHAGNTAANSASDALPS